MRFITVILFLLLVAGNLYPQDNNTPVPFTLGDRDRLMRNEQNIKNVRTEIDALRAEMNVKFESVQDSINSTNARIDDLKDLFGYVMALLILIIGAIMSLIGYVIYDRRTAIKPVLRQQDNLEKVLVEYAKEDKRLRELLKNAGIF